VAGYAEGRGLLFFPGNVAGYIVGVAGFYISVAGNTLGAIGVLIYSSVSSYFNS
jgi:hypothetical protein